MMNKKNDNLIIGINLGDFGSTGNIMLNSLEYAHNNGPFDTIACIPYKTKQHNPIETFSFEVKISKVKRGFYKLLRILRFPIINDGNYYNEFTKKLIAIIKEQSKDYEKTIVHMHNMHMCNLNVNRFYKWLGKNDNYVVLYTLHDCWTFTGGCYHYSHVNCNKWQNKCKNCPQNIYYSSMQLQKRTKLLNKIPNIKFINVSSWANDQFQKSKLKSKFSIVNLGETSINSFCADTNIKNELHITNKKIILFVSAYWGGWKGSNYIYELANKIDNDYVIIVIGGFDAKNYTNIIQFETMDQNKLAEFYFVANVYVSVTQAEQLGLTTCEAQICGTPVVGFGNCGSRETFINGKTGILVENNNVDKLWDAIKYVVETKPFKRKDIIEFGNKFKKFEHAKRQLDIYIKSIDTNN